MKVTQQEYCYKCHQYMNNLGLPFEQYDHYGRYRTVEHVLDAVATEKNVNKKGQSQGPIYTSCTVDTSGIIDQVEVAAIVAKCVIRWNWSVAWPIRHMLNKSLYVMRFAIGSVAMKRPAMLRVCKRCIERIVNQMGAFERWSQHC